MCNLQAIVIEDSFYFYFSGQKNNAMQYCKQYQSLDAVQQRATIADMECLMDFQSIKHHCNIQDVHLIV